MSNTYTPYAIHTQSLKIDDDHRDRSPSIMDWILNIRTFGFPLIRSIRSLEQWVKASLTFKAVIAPQFENHGRLDRCTCASPPPLVAGSFYKCLSHGSIALSISIADSFIVHYTQKLPLTTFTQSFKWQSNCSDHWKFPYSLNANVHRSINIVDPDGKYY